MDSESLEEGYEEMELDCHETECKTDKCESSQGLKDSDESAVNGDRVITNPLLLPAVLEAVFQNLPHQDLQQCRQVCKFWDKEATRTFNLRLKIDVNDLESVENVLQQLHQLPALRISELNAYNLNLSEASFQDLFAKAQPTLSIFRITDGQITLPKWTKLMRKASNLIKLEIGALKDVDAHLKLFPVYSSSHLELQFLHLQYLEFLSYGTTSSIFLSDVIRSCPKLKKLIAYNFPEENPQHYEDLRLPDLEVFYVPQLNGLRDIHVECLLKLELSLKELMFNNFDSNLSPTLIRKFVESQSNTLTSLLLTHSRNEQHDYHDPFLEHNPSCPFPFSLHKLKYLEVEKPFVRNMSHVINSSMFPSLSHLSLRFHPGANWEGCLPKNLKTHEGVLHLTIQWIEEKPMMQMAKAFPNLRSLDIMFCDDALLRIIYIHMPQLEILNIEDSEYRRITDEGLTGLADGSTEDCSRQWPYIGSLKNLNLLSLDFKYHPVTEKSILKGIVEATSLKVLRIAGMQISTEVANIILEKLVNLKTHCMRVEGCHNHGHQTGSECEESEESDENSESEASEYPSELPSEVDDADNL